MYLEIRRRAVPRVPLWWGRYLCRRCAKVALQVMTLSTTQQRTPIWLLQPLAWPVLLSQESDLLTWYSDGERMSSQVCAILCECIRQATLTCIAAIYERKLMQNLTNHAPSQSSLALGTGD